MKVSNQIPVNPQSVEKTKDSGAAAKSSSVKNTAATSTELGGASVEISEHAQLMKQASEIAKSTPDIRWDKVNALKQSIKNGTYQVESSKVADRLVDEHVRNDFGKNLL
ncbi:flagellar biosynthesis anti-sigma factor FlgM [bacterium]|nr:flagellar biosynthesis anti-sigma factor FlgM [bacterium]NBW98367.1 flagellar biosynthesis anti-sigma factor FlgM [bacterium]